MKVDFLEIGLRLVRYGFAVFPLAVAGKEPAIRRDPAIAKGPWAGRGCRDASRGLAVVEAWAQKYPYANAGVATGTDSGVVVIDEDPRNGSAATLAELATRGRLLPRTPCVRTGNGGRHHFFRLDGLEIGNGTNVLGAGLDV